MKEQRLALIDFLEQGTRGVCLDVRAPAEYAAGHLPGAINLPLFSDAERARIGTAYKQESPQTAFELGLLYVGPKMPELLRNARKLSAGKPLYLYCWRGGQRSGALAWLFGQAGLEVYVLEGGYKSWRNYVHRLFEQAWQLRLIGGKTGSGKTELLHVLQALGAQVLDLEALAHHKGSAFGAFNQPLQPSNEHFMNRLAAQLHQLDASKPVWVEDESRMIGHLPIPEPLYHQMQQAPLWVLEVPHDRRMQRLLIEYGKAEQRVLQQGFERIGRKLGGQHLKAALEALQQGDLTTAASIALRYYDRAYERDLVERAGQHQKMVATQGLSTTELARQLLELGKEQA